MLPGEFVGFGDVLRHIVIGMNPKKCYPVSPGQRKEIIEQALPSIGAGNAKATWPGCFDVHYIGYLTIYLLYGMAVCVVIDCSSLCLSLRCGCGAT